MTIPFSDFMANGAITGIELSRLGRIDMLFRAPDSTGLKIWVTGIRLVTQEELLRL